MTNGPEGERRWARGGRIVPAALVMALAGGAAQPAGDAAAGKRVLGRCQGCRQVGPEARSLVGPELDGVVGRTSGMAEAFACSPALKLAAIVWDEAAIAAYVAAPQKVVKGSRMAPQPGLKDADVETLVAYLATFGPDRDPAQ